jgi:hypothetical protein
MEVSGLVHAPGVILENLSEYAAREKQIRILVYLGIFLTDISLAKNSM